MVQSLQTEVKLISYKKRFYTFILIIFDDLPSWIQLCIEPQLNHSLHKNNISFVHLFLFLSKKFLVVFSLILQQCPTKKQKYYEVVWPTIKRDKNTKCITYKRLIFQIREYISRLEKILLRRNSQHENSYLAGFFILDCYSLDLNRQLFGIKGIKLVSPSTLLWLNSERYIKNLLLLWWSLYWKDRTSFTWFTSVSFVNKMLL